MTRDVCLAAILLLMTACVSIHEPARLGGPCSFPVGDVAAPGRTWGQWQTWNRTVTVCGYGAAPNETSPGVFEGSEFAVVSKQAGTEGVIIDVGPTRRARFQRRDKTIYITEVLESGAPLVEYALSLGQSSDYDKTFFVYPGQPFDEAQFQAAVQAVNQESLAPAERIALLRRIRDFGVNAPRQALPVVVDLRRAAWAEGEVAQMLDDMIAQLYLARALPHRTG